MEPFYKLFNSGTSEGVKKAWETRRGAAMDASKAADDATDEADKANPGEGDYSGAAFLHRQARQAHREAAESAPDNEAKEFHTKEASRHHTLVGYMEQHQKGE